VTVSALAADPKTGPRGGGAVASAAAQSRQEVPRMRGCDAAAAGARGRRGTRSLLADPYS